VAQLVRCPSVESGLLGDDVELSAACGWVCRSTGGGGEHEVLLADPHLADLETVTCLLPPMAAKRIEHWLGSGE
jgi:hypothetical protein